MIKPIVVMSVCLSTSPIWATEIYRSVAPDGTVTFTDQPQPNAERIELHLPSVPVVPPVEIPTESPSDRTSNLSETIQPDIEPVPAEVSYRMRWIEPVDDESIWHNDGMVTVLMQVDPELNADLGHAMQLMLNGQAYGEPQLMPRFELQNIERGTHQIQISVVDRTGQTVQSSTPLSFHLHRTSVLHPNRPGAIAP